MNAFRDLEFDRIRDRVAAFASTAAGALQLSTLTPYLDREQLMEAQWSVSEILRRAQKGEPLPTGEVEELTTLFEMVGHDGAVAELEQLRRVLSLLEYAGAVRRFFVRPEVGETGVVIDAVPSGLTGELSRHILPDGTLTRRRYRSWRV